MAFKRSTATSDGAIKERTDPGQATASAVQM